MIDSGKTPPGLVWIDEKIGDGASIDTLFKARQPIGLYRACEHKDVNFNTYYVASGFANT